ncbi:MAG TPA: glycosyltransferase [Candidatus Paceibacterota bacterium]|nr:glycosyltransferase [Candidatus Paceibacterota bacterium]
MRVLQIGSDRSKRGDLVPGSPGSARQEAYARAIGHIDDVSFSLLSDGFVAREEGALSVYPTNSASKLFYGLDAIRIAKTVPQPDVVSAQDPFESGLVAWFIARKKHVPLYVQVHTDFLSPEYARHSLLNRVRVWIAWFVLPRATRIRVVSDRIKHSIEHAYRATAPITVLPVFADLARVRVASGSTLDGRFSKFATRLLVVSRLEPEKHISLAIAAFAEAAPSDACLVVVGDGSQRTTLATLARERGVIDRVFFEGERDGVPYFAHADLVLFPSHYDGFGLVIAEALAAGKPVLATDVGIAREAGAIVTDEAHFPEALKHWFHNGPRTGQLGINMFEQFDDYVRAYAADINACVDGEKSQY